jgi:glycosyltransferase involved in cell wall biosynthesis/SAM-dependent methyltransferase
MAQAGPEQATVADAPVVTVVIPTQHAHPYLGQTLRSVAAQSLTEFTAFVVDDSSGREKDIRELIGSFDTRFRYLQTERPSGPGGARNAGVRAAGTPLVAFLDDDDTWAPGFLKEQLAYLERHPELDLVYANASLEGSEAVAGMRFMDLAPSRGTVTLDSLLACRCSVLTSCVVARRDALVRVGLFTEEPDRQEDFDLWVRLVYHGGRIGYQRRVLAARRERPHSLSGDRARMVARQLATFSALEAKLDLSPRSRRLLRSLAARENYDYAFDLVKEALADRQYDVAARELARARSFRRTLRTETTRIGLVLWPRLIRGLYLRKRRWFGRRVHKALSVPEKALSAPPVAASPFDRAGKAYWDAAWSAPDLPQAVDPASRSIWAHRDQRFHQFFSELFARRNGPPGALLEIGCARSAWLPYFAREFGFSVYGLDYSEVGTRQAQEVLRRHGVAGHVECADLFAPPDGWERAFDVVVSLGVMEHFGDTARALASAAAYLKPGGLLITEVPNLVGINGWIQSRLNRPVFDIHVPMSVDSLAAHHVAAGLAIERCEYVVPTDFGVLNLVGLPRDLSWRIKDRLLYGLRLLSGCMWWLDRRIGPFSPGRLSAGFVVCAARKPPAAV